MTCTARGRKGPIEYHANLLACWLRYQRLHSCRPSILFHREPKDVEPLIFADSDSGPRAERKQPTQVDSKDRLNS
jgi:hypothetical protein